MASLFDDTDTGLEGDALAVSPNAREARRDISPAARAILRGTKRYLAVHGFGALEEMSLETGRRVDLMALSAKSEVVIIEVKSGLADWRADTKWQEYLPYCDRFFIAVDQEFPLDVLRQDIANTREVGIIVADRHGADIVQPAEKTSLHAARRKALVSRFAYIAGRRFVSDAFALPC